MNLLQKLRNVAREPRPIRYLIGEALARSGFSRFFTIRRDGYRLRFWPSHLSTLMWVEGPHKNTQDERVLAELLRGGDTVVDVGANIGTLTLTAARLVGPTGFVRSIEAHPRTFAYLAANVALNPFTNIQLVQCAVGRDRGTVAFSDSKFDDVNRVSTVGITVPLERLDELVADLTSIRLLKVDVEGFEPQVLAGAGAMLARTDAVFIEWAPANLAQFGYGTDDLFAPLVGAGFTLYVEGGDGWRRAERRARVESYTNLLGLRDPAWWKSARGLRLP